MSTPNTLEICSNLDKALKQFGNINFLSKEDLYLLIDYIRDCFNINIHEVFNTFEFCKNNFKNIINFEFHKFNDHKIGGFLVKNKYPEQSYITINASKESKSMLFDLTHEIIHFLLHPENRKHYISSSLCDLDNFDWQANEGAAELLVPYKRFIPQFVKHIKQCNSKEDYFECLNYLSYLYKVSSAVIEYRINGLKYEIYQYESGTPINKLQLLSKTAQEEKGIYITSYSSIFRNQNSNSDLKTILTHFPIIQQNTSNQNNNTQNTEKIWKDILNTLKNNGKINLYIILMNTTLTENDQTITINFDTITNFSKSILMQEYNIDTLKQILKENYPKNMYIKIYNKQKQEYIYDEFIESILPHNKKDIFLS